MSLRARQFELHSECQATQSDMSRPCLKSKKEKDTEPHTHLPSLPKLDQVLVRDTYGLDQHSL